MTQKFSKDLTVKFGDDLILEEGCERKYNGRFVGYGCGFSKSDNGGIPSSPDGVQMRSYKFTPKGIGEFSFRYEVNPLDGMGEAIRVTTYNITVIHRGD